MAIIEFKKKKKRIFQFRIDIRGAKPPIWRRVQVKDDISFEELHLVIQNCFEWMNSHMHHFVIDRKNYIVDMENEYYEPDFMGNKEYNEKEILLKNHFKKEGDSIFYDYDFGDNWEHIIKLEKILEPKAGQCYPYITAGKKHAPFDDCGGIWGWQELCDLMEGKELEDKEEMEYLLNMYEKFDPNDFDKEDMELINEDFENWEKVKEDMREGIF